MVPPIKTVDRGAVVVIPDRDAVDEARSVRIRIEPYAVERSLPVLIAGEFLQLEERLQQFVDRARSGDIGSMIEAHSALHGVFYECADHHMLLDIWQTLEPTVRLHLRSSNWSPSRVETWVRSHEALVDIIRAGKPPMIAKAVADHITGSATASSADHHHS